MKSVPTLPVSYFLLHLMKFKLVHCHRTPYIYCYIDIATLFQYFNDWAKPSRRTCCYLDNPPIISVINNIRTIIKQNNVNKAKNTRFKQMNMDQYLINCVYLTNGSLITIYIRNTRIFCLQSKNNLN